MSPRLVQEAFVAGYFLLHDTERLLLVVKYLSTLVRSFETAAYLPELLQYCQAELSKVLLVVL
jgi:hypothetical protein